MIGSWKKILYEFPVRQIEYYIPKWVELLPVTHYLERRSVETEEREDGNHGEYIRDIRQEKSGDGQ